jgi:hypothetical protein
MVNATEFVEFSDIVTRRVFDGEPPRLIKPRLWT